MSDDGEYFFCLKHHTVEGAEGCKAADRLGPYRTEAEASRALDKVRERNEEWDDDPDWNDGPAHDGPAHDGPVHGGPTSDGPVSQA